MTSKGDEGGADDFARFRVVAYRLADQDGWYLAETALSLEEFGSALLREGEALTALREIHTGFRRVAPGEKFRATGMFSFTTGAGPSTSGRIAGARRARTCSPRRRRVSGRDGAGGIGPARYRLAPHQDRRRQPGNRLQGERPRFVHSSPAFSAGWRSWWRVKTDGSSPILRAARRCFSFATADLARARVVASLSGNLAPDEYRKVCLHRHRPTPVRPHLLRQPALLRRKPALRLYPMGRHPHAGGFGAEGFRDRGGGSRNVQRAGPACEALPRLPGSSRDGGDAKHRPGVQKGGRGGR